MNETELIQCCEADGILYAKGTHEDAAGYWLHWQNPRDPEDQECSFVRLDALAGLAWPQVRRFLVNGRDVAHVSRVVGYFSRLDNWNPSKIGELKDRRRGEYAVTENSGPAAPGASIS